MKKYIMALDEGTTSARTVLVDHNGQIVSQCSKEFTQIFPKAGWVEHNAVEIWDAQKETIIGALKQAGATLGDIDSVGITNQRETTIVWNKNTGKPVYNAIVWQCRRTSEMVDAIKDMLEKDGKESLICDKTGLTPDAYFSATKIKWIIDNVVSKDTTISADDLIFGTIDTWLVWNLTGGKVHATDYTNASRTMLFDIHKLDWDDELLNVFGVERLMLPEVKKSSDDYGCLSPKLVAEINQALNESTLDNIPINGVAGDQQAALFGQCCFEVGDVKNTYGTGGFLMMNTGDKPVKSTAGLLTTIAASTDHVEYALEGSVFVSGSAIQWLRDELKIVDSAPASEEVASSVEDTNGVYVVPAFTGLGAPYWNQDARGTIVGLTRGTSREHLVRATLESLAYQTNDVLEAMKSDLAQSQNAIIDDMKVDGGASKNNLLMQFQADISGLVVKRPELVETTAIGAAYLAGLCTGFWKDKNELKSHNDKNDVFQPTMAKEKVDKCIKGWKRAVKCAIAYTED